MTKQIKIVNVGAGFVVNNRHILALKKSGLFDLVGVVSKHSDHAAKTATQFGIPYHSDRLDFSAGWAAEADAVMIGTIPQVHHEIAMQALQAGKHVLMEKPMTIAVKDAQDLQRVAREKKRVLAVVHNVQFSRCCTSLRQHLADGSLGAIRAVYGGQLSNPLRKFPGWIEDLPLGLFYDESPHFCYVFRLLAKGTLTLDNATIWRDKQMNTPHMVNATYYSGDGIPFFLHADFKANLTEWGLLVTTEKASAVIDFWRDTYIYLPNDGSDGPKDLAKKTAYLMHQHFWGAVSAGVRHVSKQQLFGNVELVTRFYKAIHGEDTLQGMDGEAGIRAVEMQHELIDKARYR